MTNTILFGTGAGLVILAWIKAIRGRGSSEGLLEAVFTLQEPLLLITMAILFGGVFHSFTILYPMLIEAREVQEKTLSEMDDYRDQAYRDPLTNLHNRRYFDEIAGVYFNEFRKMRQSFGLLVIDVDHFKQINDNHGHAAGDEVLKDLAHCLGNMVRDHDIVSRIGGEEFAVVITRVNAQILEDFSDRMRRAVANLSIAYEGKYIQPTISIGAVLSSDFNTVDEMIQKADNLLYRAKENGRNRVVTTHTRLAA